MLEITRKTLIDEYGITKDVFDLYERALKDVESEFKYYDEIREYNQLKVLKAFKEERISESHFTYSSGYGYNDIGRDSLDKVYADIFHTESAFVRPHFVNGTHAIGAVLFGNLRPGDTMISICGMPYDTLHDIIGIGDSKKVGSLKEYGVNHKIVDLKHGKIDVETVKRELKEDKSIKLVHIQRSTGYGWRKSLNIKDMSEVIKAIRTVNENVIVFVDNCYGEFVEDKEPTDVGADIIAGSLIKNIGGGIATTGGYIAGKEEYVEQATYRVTVPGIGGECGSTFGVMRQFFEGLFMAPHVAIEAVKGAVFCARIMELCGFDVLPKYSDRRTDIIQAIKFNDEKKLINFIKGIQYAAPVDSFAECEPWDMPGYEDKVIMAAGTFVQGASIELSADAPIREPYVGYLQGGLNFDHAKIGILVALSNLIKKSSK